jgi:transcriptional regulator with XRE-family HTH domain
MSTSQQLFEITKRKLSIRFDRELAEMLGITKSALSQKQKRGDFPFLEIRQLLQSKGLDVSWLKSHEEGMQKELYQDGPEARLRDKDQIIQIQQDYINDLKKTIERMEEEDKKKWIPTKVPELINHPHNWVNL